MTNYNERLYEILSKTPCSQCDGSGAYPDYDGEPVQCQFCWQLRFTFIDEAKQAILDWHHKQVEIVLDRIEATKTIYKTRAHNDKGVLATTIVTTGIPLNAIQAERNKLKEQTNDRL
mgnify:CR=1 FL=1